MKSYLIKRQELIVTTGVLQEWLRDYEERFGAVVTIETGPQREEDDSQKEETFTEQVDRESREKEARDRRARSKDQEWQQERVTKLRELADTQVPPRKLLASELRSRVDLLEDGLATIFELDSLVEEAAEWVGDLKLFEKMTKEVYSWAKEETSWEAKYRKWQEVPTGVWARTGIRRIPVVKAMQEELTGQRRLRVQEQLRAATKATSMSTRLMGKLEPMIDRQLGKLADLKKEMDDLLVQTEQLESVNDPPPRTALQILALRRSRRAVQQKEKQTEQLLTHLRKETEGTRAALALELGAVRRCKMLLEADRQIRQQSKLDRQKPKQGISEKSAIAVVLGGSPAPASGAAPSGERFASARFADQVAAQTGKSYSQKSRAVDRRDRARESLDDRMAKMDVRIQETADAQATDYRAYEEHARLQKRRLHTDFQPRQKGVVKENRGGASAKRRFKVNTSRLEDLRERRMQMIRAAAKRGREMALADEDGPTQSGRELAVTSSKELALISPAAAAAMVSARPPASALQVTETEVLAAYYEARYLEEVDEKPGMLDNTTVGEYVDWKLWKQTKGLVCPDPSKLAMLREKLVADKLRRARRNALGTNAEEQPQPEAMAPGAWESPPPSPMAQEEDQAEEAKEDWKLAPCQDGRLRPCTLVDEDEEGHVVRMHRTGTLVTYRYEDLRPYGEFSLDQRVEGSTAETSYREDWVLVPGDDGKLCSAIFMKDGVGQTSLVRIIQWAHGRGESMGPWKEVERTQIFRFNPQAHGYTTKAAPVALQRYDADGSAALPAAFQSANQEFPDSMLALAPCQGELCLARVLKKVGPWVQIRFLASRETHKIQMDELVHDLTRAGEKTGEAVDDGTGVAPASGAPDPSIPFGSSEGEPSDDDDPTGYRFTIGEPVLMYLRDKYYLTRSWRIEKAWDRTQGVRARVMHLSVKTSRATPTFHFGPQCGISMMDPRLLPWNCQWLGRSKEEGPDLSRASTDPPERWETEELSSDESCAGPHPHFEHPGATAPVYKVGDAVLFAHTRDSIWVPARIREVRADQRYPEAELILTQDKEIHTVELASPGLMHKIEGFANVPTDVSYVVPPDSLELDRANQARRQGVPEAIAAGLHDDEQQAGDVRLTSREMQADHWGLFYSGRGLDGLANWRALRGSRPELYDPTGAAPASLRSAGWRVQRKDARGHQGVLLIKDVPTGVAPASGARPPQKQSFYRATTDPKPKPKTQPKRNPGPGKRGRSPSPPRSSPGESKRQRSEPLKWGNMVRPEAERRRCTSPKPRWSQEEWDEWNKRKEPARSSASWGSREPPASRGRSRSREPPANFQGWGPRTISRSRGKKPSCWVCKKSGDNCETHRRSGGAHFCPKPKGFWDKKHGRTGGQEDDAKADDRSWWQRKK